MKCSNVLTFVITAYAIVYAVSLANRGTINDGDLLWMARHPWVSVALIMDPPPPQSDLVRGLAWSYEHRDLVAAIFADPPPGQRR